MRGLITFIVLLAFIVSTVEAVGNSGHLKLASKLKDLGSFSRNTSIAAALTSRDAFPAISLEFYAPASGHTVESFAKLLSSSTPGNELIPFPAARLAEGSSEPIDCTVCESSVAMDWVIAAVSSRRLAELTYYTKLINEKESSRSRTALAASPPVAGKVKQPSSLRAIDTSESAGSKRHRDDPEPASSESEEACTAVMSRDSGTGSSKASTRLPAAATTKPRVVKSKSGGTASGKQDTGKRLSTGSSKHRYASPADDSDSESSSRSDAHGPRPSLASYKTGVPSGPAAQSVRVASGRS